MVSRGRDGAAACASGSGTREEQPFELGGCTLWLSTKGLCCCTEVSAMIIKRERDISATDFTTTFNTFVFFARFLDKFVSSFDMVLQVSVLMWLYVFHPGHQNGLHCCTCDYQ